MTPRWPRPDFLDTGPRRPAWVAWWAAGAVAVAATTAVDAWSQAHELQASRDRLDRATQRLADAARATGVPDALAPQASASAPIRSELDSIRAAQHVARRLDHPWDRIVADLEASTPAGLQWLALDHDSDEPRLQLEGSAPDLATVLKAVDGLSARGGWSDVALSRLQAPDAEGATWRFALHADFAAPRAASAQQVGIR